METQPEQMTIKSKSSKPQNLEKPENPTITFKKEGRTRTISENLLEQHSKNKIIENLKNDQNRPRTSSDSNRRHRSRSKDGLKKSSRTRSKDKVDPSSSLKLDRSRS